MASPRGRAAPLLALLGLVLLSLRGCGAARSIELPITDDLLAIARRHLMQISASNWTTCKSFGNWGPTLNESCIAEDAKNGKVLCTANDVDKITAFLIVDADADNASRPLVYKPCCFDTTATCVLCEKGQTLVGTLNLTITVTSSQRYNLGLWVAEAGSTPCPDFISGAVGSIAGCPNAFATCTKNAFIPNGSPFTASDGGSGAAAIDVCCGDLDQGTWSNILVPSYRLTCEGNTTTNSTPAVCANSAEPLDWCIGWGTGGTPNVPQCELGSTQGYQMTGPDQSSKCTCNIARLGGVEVFAATCGDLDFNPNVTTPFVCPPPPNYVRKPNIENYTNPSVPNCCTFVPTCAWPTESAPSTRWTCPPGALYNASAANASSPSNTVCCLPTCARRNVSVAGAWPCSPPLSTNASAANNTPPSNATCCFVPTCLRPFATNTSSWPCAPPLVYNSSANSATNPSNATCCFTPTCGRPNATAGTWTCPPGALYNASAANVGSPSDVACCLPTCARRNVSVAGAWPCSPPLVFNTSAANNTPPSNATCCSFTPTCGRPNATVVGTWDCPPGALYNASAANATSPSNVACCLPTCARRNVSAAGNWTCSPPLLYNASAASATPPSNATCCLPTCGQRNVNTPGAWTCTLPLAYNSSAVGLTPPSNETCCFFVPICAQQAPSLPYNLSWDCPPRSERIPSEANTPANASNFNDICCTAQAAIPPQVNLTASGDKRACTPGAVLSYSMTVLSYGAGNASNVTLTNFYAEPGLTYMNASCPGASGSCTFTPGAPTSSGLVVCELGRMDAVRAITCTFTVSLGKALPDVFSVDGSLDVFDDDGNQVPSDGSMTASLVLSTVNCTASELPLQDGDNCTCVPAVPVVALATPSAVCTNNTAARVPYTMVVSSVGNGTAPFVVLTSNVQPAGLSLTDAFAVCRWPNGTIVTGDNPLLGCTVTPNPDADTSYSVECVLGPMPVGMNISCTFQPLASPPLGWGSYVFTVDGLLTIYNDSTLLNALDPGPNADGSFDMTLSKCPPYQAYNPSTCSCDVLNCNPCGTANPTVYFTTGTAGVPQNSLWQVPNFALNNFNQRAWFVCQIVGMTAGATTGDIAMLWDGSVLVLDTSGGLGYIPVGRLPAPSAGPTGTWTSTTTVASTLKCTVIPLFKFNVTDGYTGLANAFTSDEFWASTGRGYVRNIFLTANNTINGGNVSGEPGDLVDYNVGCSVRSASVVNTGGTDLTAGPDGNVYRWAAMQNTNPMNYTGTRLVRNSLGLTRAWQFVSDNATNTAATAIYNVNTLANAGAFCTSSTVIGTALVTAGNGSAGFLEFGYSGAAWVSPLPDNTYVGTGSTTVLKRARLVAQARPTNNVKDAMRINGAAVRPVCTLPTASTG